MNIQTIAEGITGIGLLVYFGYKAYNKVKDDLPIHKQYDFTKHQFFRVMSDAILYLVPNLTYEHDPVRTDIVKLYAHEKLSLFRDRCKEAAETFSKGKGKHCFTEQAFLEFFDKTIEEYRIKAIAAVAKKYGQEIAELFDYKFTNIVHYGCIRTTRDTISNICRSGMYLSCSDKFSAILDILTFAFQHTVIDLEQTCKVLNGELKEALIKLDKPHS